MIVTNYVKNILGVDIKILTGVFNTRYGDFGRSNRNVLDNVHNITESALQMLYEYRFYAHTQKN